MRSPPLRPRRPSAPMLVALLALFVALGGPAQAERLISGAKIKRNSVASKQVKDRSLKQRDLSRPAVRALRATPAGSITAAKLAPNAVTSRALAPDSVGSANVGDNSLGGADLAGNAVGTDEIADNAVGQTEIRGNGVGASEIADSSIDGGEIVDGGLSVRDAARQTGTLRWPVGDLGHDACEVKWVPVSDIQIAGDYVLISPTSAWPRDLVYTVNGTNAESEFKVQACNRGSATVPGATYTFNYAVIGY